jgi:histidyl-tRNA synthetase
MSVREQVFGSVYRVLERYGYTRYDGPVLEPAEIYEAKSGQEIAHLQLYTLQDRSGRRLALRPEMTPSVARMIAGNAGAISFPARWYCNVNCHRYERPQRGRLREHWQVNADIFGSASLSAEIEIFELVHDLFAALGATRDMYVVRVSDRILLDWIIRSLAGVSADKVRLVSGLIDRWEKYPREQIQREASEAGLTADQFGTLERALTSGPEIAGQVPAEVLQASPVAQLLSSPESARLFTFDPLIVRGFEYYNSTVFEVFDTDPANRRSLFGGGRYDDLTGLFSRQQIQGIGFAIGDVTLFDFLATHGLLPGPEPEYEVAVLPTEPGLDEAARRVARVLRDAGLRTATALDGRRIGKEIPRAVKAGARAVVIVGPDDWSAGNVTVRDLATGEQHTVPYQDAARGLARS